MELILNAILVLFDKIGFTVAVTSLTEANYNLIASIVALLVFIVLLYYFIKAVFMFFFGTRKVVKK